MSAERPRVKTLWVRDEYLAHILNGEKTVEVRVGYKNIFVNSHALNDENRDSGGHPRKQNSA